MSRKKEEDDFQWYMSSISDREPLTAEKEIELARRIREESDPYAREEMIKANLRLVVKTAAKYSCPGMTIEDLVEEGNLGLIRAVEEFDPDMGHRFSTYAVWWIKHAIRHAMIQRGRPIRIPDYLAKLIGKWRRAASEITAQLGRPPTSKEIAEKLGVGPEKAEVISQGLAAASIPVHIDDGDESAASSEIFVDDGPGPDQNLLDKSDGPIVRSLLERLDPRDREVVELRFGLDAKDSRPMTYDDVARHMDLTRERVRQINNEALAKMQKMIDDLL